MSRVGWFGKPPTCGVNVVQIADNLPLDELTIAELKDLRIFLRLRVDLQVGTRGVDAPPN